MFLNLLALSILSLFIDRFWIDAHHAKNSLLVPSEAEILMVGWNPSHPHATTTTKGLHNGPVSLKIIEIFVQKLASLNEKSAITLTFDIMGPLHTTARSFELLVLFPIFYDFLNNIHKRKNKKSNILHNISIGLGNGLSFTSCCPTWNNS